MADAQTVKMMYALQQQTEAVAAQTPLLARLADAAERIATAMENSPRPSAASKPAAKSSD